MKLNQYQLLSKRKKLYLVVFRNYVIILLYYIYYVLAVLIHASARVWFPKSTSIWILSIKSPLSYTQSIQYQITNLFVHYFRLAICPSLSITLQNQCSLPANLFPGKIEIGRSRKNYSWKIWNRSVQKFSNRSVFK